MPVSQASITFLYKDVHVLCVLEGLADKCYGSFQANEDGYNKIAPQSATRRTALYVRH